MPDQNFLTITSIPGGMSDGSDGYAAMGYGCSAAEPNNINVVTRDADGNWSHAGSCQQVDWPEDHLFCKAAHFMDALTGVAVMSQANAGYGPTAIFRTTDGGASWTNTYSLFVDSGLDGIVDMHFFDDLNGVALATWFWESALLKTTDGGLTWEELHVDALNEVHLESLSALDNGAFMVLGSQFGTDFEPTRWDVYRFENYGDTFEVVVRGCTFRRNVSSDWGGAMSAALWEDDNLTIADCLFEDNTSGDGGHLVLVPNGPDGHISVEQCTFRRGSGDQIGGLRIVNQGIGAEGFAEVALLDCLFEDHEQDGVSASGEVSLTIDGGSFMNSGMPTVNLITPATAEVSNTQFCGSAVHIAGTWTDLGGNSFTFICPCPGDGFPDGTVDVHDLLGMIAAFGSDDETWDFDGDGLVGVNDMLVLIASWGPC